MSFRNISLPLLFFQEPSPKKERTNTHPPQRTISNPHGLTVPSRSQSHFGNHRVDTPTHYLAPPPHDVKGKRRIEYLDPPRRAASFTEKPDRPRQYSLNGKFTPSVSLRYGDLKTQKLMEKSTPRQKINDRVIAFAVTLTLAILLAIGIPLAVILPIRYSKPLPINVLIPFFVSPENDSWKRLETAIIKYHDINFTVVVNPDNGPGNTTWPSAPYISAIKTINVLPNVHTLGYINTDRGTLPNATVRAQIATYAGWKNVGAGLRGIYLDHTPWKADAEGLMKAYLRNADMTVKLSGGWNGQGQGLVVHNPGRIPDPELMAVKPDITVIYEGTYELMPEREDLHGNLTALGGGREDWAMMVNSVPEDLGRGGLRKIVERVRRDVEWLYVTDLTKDFYSDYGSNWEGWLDVAW